MLDAPHLTPDDRPPVAPAPHRRLALTALTLLAAVGALTACAPVIGVPVADDAANPRCAEVVLAVPDVLGGQSGPDGGAATGTSSDVGALHKAKTNSQATAAWGVSGAAVTLRCGVEVPGPTTTSCQTVDSGGFSVDWLIIPSDDGTWTFVTYGRDPAVEVQVPPAVAETRSTAFVADLNRAVSKVPQTRTCVGVGDLPEDQPAG